MLEKIKSVIWGVAIGDALGVPYEFQHREALRAGGPVVMRGYGTWNQPEGTWSDDTSLTICLLKSLSLGLNYEDMAARFLSWKEHAYLTARDETFDIGHTTDFALENVKRGVPPLISGEKGELSNGNGSLMRISPLAFYLINKNVPERREIVFNVSSITHGHIRSKTACWFYIEVLMKLLHGQDKEEAVEGAWFIIENWLKAEELWHELKIFSRCRSSLKEVHESEIRSSGYVIDTLEAALFCFLTTRSYEEAVMKAVSLGEDTDSVAAVTGGLAGLNYGFSTFPSRWINTLKKPDLINDLCLEFSDSLIE